MEQFSELSDRIERLQGCIDSSEAEEARLAEEAKLLKAELALEEQAERQRRLEVLKLQNACVQHELSMVENQDSTARLEEQAAALEYKLADAATSTNRSENQCPQQQRLDEIAFHKEERTVFKRWLEREHVGAAEASEAASKAGARHKRQAAQAELQAKQLDAELKKARAALHTLSTTTPAAVASRISGLKREWEALGSALRRCRARHADVCTRQGVAEKQLQEEERMSQQLSDSINNLKRTNAAARATPAAATAFTEDTTDRTSTASRRGRGRGRGNGTTTKAKSRQSSQQVPTDRPSLWS